MWLDETCHVRFMERQCKVDVWFVIRGDEGVDFAVWFFFF